MQRLSLAEKDRQLLGPYGLQTLDLSHAVRISLARGEYLSRAGEPMDELYIVVSGKAKVFISLSDGKELLLAYFTQRGIIGEIELMTDALTTQTTVQAVTELVCVAFPLRVYAKELKRNNVFINYVAKDLAEKLAQRVVNSAITALQPLETRLCAYILQTATGGVFHEKLTELAGVMGASYRHLLRCLGKLCEKNILLKTPQGYQIINRRVMEMYAGDLYVLK
ncbi:MAG: cyclic nucleotide-binding domain-containing protein [Defluviitaleaceae bacterium]|nr:cyclic nucleotide-binding domain-containing protein [Defluviitaleaceae bacterium]